MNQSDGPSNPEPSAEETIKLDQFMKLANLASTGGEAKHLIRDGKVSVNGKREIRRGRKLRSGDIVTYAGEDYVIETD